MPGAKNGGKTQGFFEVFADAWKVDPTAAGATLEDTITLDDKTSAPALVTPAAYAKCKVELSLRNGGLTFVLTEPGCDSMKITDEKLKGGLEARATAVHKPSGAKVPLHIKLAPKK